MRLGLACALALLALPAAVAVSQSPYAQDPPYLLDLEIRPKHFVPPTSGGPVSTGRGTTVTYELSGSGPVRFWVAKWVDGYYDRADRRCERKRGARRGRKICTFYERIGRSWVVEGVNGRNTFRFTGRPSGRALKPRWYFLFGQPVGRQANKKRHHFHILARR